jgi:hypothetical protein
MKSFKHSKFKNTGILFELLVRQVASDTLNNVDSKAVGIIKKFFTNSSVLSKELKLYQTLVKERVIKESKASALIDAVLEAHSRLNKSSLNKQKYNLIKEIRNTFSVEDFFKSKVNNYKTLASIYNIFEHTVADNPAEYVNNKYTLLEHLTSKALNQVKLSESYEINNFIKQDKEIRLLSYKILVDKFNTKYSTLDKNQKNILREYINSVTDGTNLKDFMIDESTKLKKNIKQHSTSVKDKVTKIKLSEVTNMLDNLCNAKIVTDSHILTLMRYHELIKELKKL